MSQFKSLLAVLTLFIAMNSSLLGTQKSLYKVSRQTDVMIPMRDGACLATDLYLPASEDGFINEKFPTLLMRTPYNRLGFKKGATINEDGKYFAEHGYAVVIQSTRGRYGSEGIWQMLTDDGRDGFDTCEWISKQSWSNGKVGTMGFSYVGGTQHALAMECSPQLVTAIPVDAMSNMGFAGIRNGGAFELRFWNWIFCITGPHGSRQSVDPEIATILLDMKEHRRNYLLDLPLWSGKTPLKFIPEYEKWLVEAMSHGLNDVFWKQNNIIDYANEYKDIPIYLVGGWYDSWAGCTTANYRVLNDAIRGPVYLIMGPWVHGSQGIANHGQVSFGAAAAIPDPQAWQLEWFDHWLKGIENSVGHSEPFATKVRIFVMGTGDGSKTPTGQLNHGGYWRSEHEWPLKRSKATPYYLQSKGRLEISPPVEDISFTNFLFDPDNPVPTIGGNISSGFGILLPGAWNQRGGTHIWNMPEPTSLSAREDVLVFQTEPLPENLEVTGEITVRLWVSSSAVDTDFTAKLIDVYPSSDDFPEGFDLNIVDGIKRARFRESLNREILMEPGEIYPLEIKLYPTSNVFKKGHRIRLDISSSNFPRFDVNPNTGEKLNHNHRKETAINTIHHDVEHPSYIELPLVPMDIHRS